jgi:large subunit ribosomal protein L25
MAEQKLVGEKREGTGKGVNRKLRAAGRVPAVLYGHGMDPISLSVDSRELVHVFHTGAGTNVLVDLVVDGTDHLAMAREIQRDHIRGRYVHVDFLEVRRDEKITISVPIKVVGDSVGVKAGGVVEHHLWDLQVECLPTNVPESVEADISSLEIGSSLKVADLVAPEGTTILTGLDESVVAVQQPQARIELEEAEAAAAAAAAEGEGEGAEGEAAPTGEAPAESAEE